MKSRMLYLCAAIFGAVVILLLIIAGCGGRGVPIPSAGSPPEPVASATVVPSKPVATSHPEVPITGATPVSEVESQPETVQGENTVLKLADGSLIILRPNAMATVVSQPPKGSATGEYEIELTSGQILVVPSKPKGLVITVKDANGTYGRLQSGCSMAVSADPATSNFGIMCLSGECELGLANNKNTKVKGNEAWLFSGGKTVGPEAIDQDELTAVFKDYLPQCAFLIPVTGQDTPQPNVAATSACNTFKAQFPGTPCP